MSTYDEGAPTAARHFIPLQEWNARAIVGTQVDGVGYRAAGETNESRKIESPVCHSNNQIWELILQNRFRRSDLRISLDSFLLFEWFPRSPGLYHTVDGRDARRRAQERIVEFTGGRVVYDPHGKASMLDGGVGAVRFRPIELAGTFYYLMTASSCGTCHEGFPIAVPEELYNRIIDEIQRRGAVVRNVTGRLRFVPERLRSFFADFCNVPQLYLVVDDVNTSVHVKSRRIEDLSVSVAVSFVSDYEDRPRMYASYVSFDPSESQGLRDAVEWIETEYVHNYYSGRVVTDFDEQVGHFPFAPFSLEKVMGCKLVGAEIAQVANVIGIDTNGILRHQAAIHQEVYMDAKYKITGGQQGAVGDNAHAQNFTQIWTTAAGTVDLRELANELTILRAAARQEATSADQDEAVGTLASAETLARQGNGPGAFEQLAKAGKWALDVATKIGVSVAVAALTHASGQK